MEILVYSIPHACISNLQIKIEPHIYNLNSVEGLKIRFGLEQHIFYQIISMYNN